MMTGQDKIHSNNSLVDKLMSWILGTNGRQRPRVTIVKPESQLQARFEAADVGAQETIYWWKVDQFDSVLMNRPEVRERIRQRARHEYSNSPYLKGQVETRVVHEVSTGPALVVNDRDVEKLWSQWAKKVKLAHKLRIMSRARIIDGECFALIVNRKKDKEIDLVPIDCDLVKGQRLPSEDYFDGLHLEDDVVVAYDIANSLEPLASFRTIKADYVVHYFRFSRPGQLRGISELAQALPVLPGIRQYIKACVRARVSAASIALAVYTDMPPEGEAEDVEPAVVDIPVGSMFRLPAGWKAQQIGALHPDPEGRLFINERVAEIGRSLLLPRNVATGDSSGYNFASGRLDYQSYFEDINCVRQDIELFILNKVFRIWSSVYLNKTVDEFSWRWPVHPYYDPEAEAKASSTLINAGLSTFPLEFNKRGLDFDEEIERQAKSLGIDADSLRKAIYEKTYLR